MDSLTQEELDRFHALNTRYQTTYGFPFIIAVAGLDKHDILRAFEERLGNDRDTEMKTALEQVTRIGAVRMERALAGG